MVDEVRPLTRVAAQVERHDTFSRVRMAVAGEENGTGRYIVASGNEKLLQISRWGKLLARHSRRHVAVDARSYMLPSRRKPLRVSNKKKM